MSCSVANEALPMTRFNSMRPAITQGAGLRRLELFLGLGAVGRVQVGGEVRAPEVVGESRARLAQLRQLRAALGDDLVLVLRRLRGGILAGIAGINHVSRGFYTFRGA
jgi:hypothetical protein